MEKEVRRKEDTKGNAAGTAVRKGTRREIAQSHLRANAITAAKSGTKEHSAPTKVVGRRAEKTGGKEEDSTAPAITAEIGT